MWMTGINLKNIFVIVKDIEITEKERTREIFMANDFYDVINSILFGFENSSMQILTFHSSA